MASVARTSVSEGSPLTAAAAAKSDAVALNIPGSNALAYVTLPLRIALWGAGFGVMFPLVWTISFSRAIFMRCRYGLPSQILRKGTHMNTNKADEHYPGHLLFDMPIEEERMRAALVGLCAEDGISEEQVELTLVDEEPVGEFHATGSWRSDHYLQHGALKGGDNHFSYWMARGGSKKCVRLHVFNGKPGKPTVVLYAGSGNGWDGSSNFNFVKELCSRYAGKAPNKVFQAPDISPEAAAKFDEGFYLPVFLARQPFNIGWNMAGALWNAIRAAKWAGGNGLGFKLCAMNFSEQDSARLYHGAKALGASPFAAFTYAVTLACEEVLRSKPLCVTQQASIQSRHYRLPGQTSRDLVGDWLFGPVQQVGEVSLQASAHAYKELITELDELGPAMKRAVWAKAYGVMNSGAAGFEIMPFYNDNMHVMDRCLFMNNYGVRSTEPEAHFHTWNWNAPLWLGLNTINVNGRTSTMIGSCLFGQELVEAVRDHTEATLRGIMAKAPADAQGIGSFKPKSK